MLLSVGARIAACCFLVLPWRLFGAAPKKIERDEDDLRESLRLESGCRGNFPSKPEECPKDLWLRCCQQEVSCHSHYCIEKILGKLTKGSAVRVHTDFTSDDSAGAELRKGMKGKVLQVDDDGDALVRFFEDDLDDQGVRHWVYRTTFWEKLELPGKMERLRALKVATCLDDCSVKQECRMNSMSKKQSKVYRECVKACKVDECIKDEEKGQCKELFTLYAECKQKVSSSDACSARDDPDQEIVEAKGEL
eukprot:TRINITY_DN23309_c0_g1_i1.p1 TRINITY_DN23309_c0_g1~~TRINITY_DN23309_c0_g1_i1.p1  ORF type:complete len:250 (-),score=55.55 TRINITY_DN23309_c0_g1_i1:62-811(-)